MMFIMCNTSLIRLVPSKKSRALLVVPSSTFFIRLVTELDFVGINVAIDDVFFNLMTKDTQLMKGSTPKRRGREKDLALLQLLIESTRHVSDIVLDCTTSIDT